MNNETVTIYEEIPGSDLVDIYECTGNTIVWVGTSHSRELIDNKNTLWPDGFELNK